MSELRTPESHDRELDDYLASREAEHDIDQKIAELHSATFKDQCDSIATLRNFVKHRKAEYLSVYNDAEAVRVLRDNAEPIDAK